MECADGCYFGCRAAFPGVLRTGHPKTHEYPKQLQEKCFKTRELQQEFQQEVSTSLNHAHSILPNKCWSRQRLIHKGKEVGATGVGTDAQLLDSIFEKLEGGADSKNHVRTMQALGLDAADRRVLDSMRQMAINSSAAWKSLLSAIGPGQLIGLNFIGFISLLCLLSY